MHHCPECGQACYCHGDIDDCVVETSAYSDPRCDCSLRESGCGRDREDYESSDDYDHEEEPPHVK